MPSKKKQAGVIEVIGALTLLFATAIELIRRNKRSEYSTKNLLKALQLFKENRLAHVLGKSMNDGIPSNIQQLLDLRVAELDLSHHARKWLENRYIIYLGEVFVVSRWSEPKDSDKTSVREIRQLLGELGIPMDLSLGAAEWMPAYANNPRVLELWAAPWHKFGVRFRCSGCRSLGEILQAKHRNTWRLNQDLSPFRRFVRSSMYVPRSWKPPEAKPEECRRFGTTLFGEIWITNRLHTRLSDVGIKQPEDLVGLTSPKLEERGLTPGDVRRLILDLEREGVKIPSEPREIERIGQEMAVPLARDIDELEFSVRTYISLKVAGIRTVRQLVQETEPELLKYKNFGKKSLAEVKEVLAEMGLSLGMNLGETPS